MHSGGSAAKLQDEAAPEAGAEQPSAEPVSVAAALGTDPTLSAEEVRTFCDFHEGYVSRNIQLADAKAGLSLVAFSSAIALILQNNQFRAQVRSTAGAFWSPNETVSWVSTFEWMGLILCAIGTVLGFWVLMPRLASGRQESSARGHTYWGDVAEHAAIGAEGSYADAIFGLQREALLRDRLDHLYQLSRICARKMHLLTWSMRTGGAGVALIILWMFFFSA